MPPPLAPWFEMAPLATAAPLSSPIDPYVLMAATTQWLDHIGRPGPPARIRVSLQLRPGAPRPVLTGFTPTPAAASARHLTGSADLVALLLLLVHPDVLRLQLADGVLPQRPVDVRRLPGIGPVPPIGPPTPAAAGTDLLLGLIDDGCPFAHVDLRRPVAGGGAPRTRLVSLWDQDGTLGSVPPAGYGAELDGGQLDRLMALATDGSGSVDEQLCYLLAGADPAFKALSHGSHALGLLAGTRRLDGRPLPGLVPPLQRLADAAAAADVAFVQLPRKLLSAPFPAALEHHAIDALRHLVDVAAQRRASRLEVLFSYDSWLGSHGDAGWFDGALMEVAAEALARGVTLTFNGVAGNAGAHNVHALATSRSDGAGGYLASFDFLLPPDHQMLTHLQLWMPGGHHTGLTLEIKPPALAPLPPVRWGDAVAWPALVRPQLCVVMQHSRVLDLNDDVVVLRISPTQVHDPWQGTAPHGRWQLTLRSDQPLDDVHLYIGRATSSLGMPTRGRQPVLLERSGGASGADRRFTLNGHANSVQAMRMLTSAVAQRSVYGQTLPQLLTGPALLSSGLAPIQAGRVAPYAARGPARAGGRLGPNAAVIVEHGVYHPGWLAQGNRSSGSFRLVGTSSAGPLGVRRRLQGAAAQVPASYPGRAEEGGSWDWPPF